ncbi:putative cyclin [Medicago truncatula]|uniref:B-like cyclin n=1 Tax=Medicago truncatula TaxID=3880 RepID=A0A396JA98_MEDTR|nr:putative cyclin [Medicago truncatula]
MDDSEPEFPIPTRKELEIIKNYFNVESEFIAATDTFTTPHDILFRNLAVSIIAKLNLFRCLSRSDDPDSFIPYLAMNYFDRFLSQHKLNLEDVEGRTETERVRLIAVSCLTISSKMRTNSFSVDRFLENLYVGVNLLRILSYG